LRLNERCQEVVQVGRVDVADGDDAQVGCGGGVEGEACAVVYGHFYFSMSEALLRTEMVSGSGQFLSLS
jgi:hypothetical protein